MRLNAVCLAASVPWIVAASYCPPKTDCPNATELKTAVNDYDAQQNMPDGDGDMITLGYFYVDRVRLYRCELPTENESVKCMYCARKRAGHLIHYGTYTAEFTKTDNHDGRGLHWAASNVEPTKN